MLFRTLTFLLFLPIQFLLGFSIEEEKLCMSGPSPEWVEARSFPLDPIALKPSEVNAQNLLVDIQTHWEEKCTYYHVVTKALTQAGVKEIAQVDVDFDPTYEKVVFHEIRVFREGCFSDRLQSSRHDVLQRERGLESSLFEGKLTLVYFLEDIREGDIVEYSFSVVGAMPYLSSHLVKDIYFQGDEDIHRLYRRILMSKSHSLAVKPFHMTVEPQIIQISDELQEWTWEGLDITPYAYEDGQPSWYDNIAHVQLSEFQSWREVIEKLYPIYILPEDFQAYTSPEMLALVQEWEEATSDPVQRAFLAVRFVQEKVRYQGFEEGINGYKPQNPRDVFQRRFGDCKDKTFLLCAFLRLMEIDSTPVLVNMDLGQRLINALPSFFAFNHVILKIDIAAKTYWVDSTIQYQGGMRLEDNFFPPYHWGLPLVIEAEGLVKLPDVEMKRPSEIETSIVLSSEDFAEMTTTWTFYDFKADNARWHIASVGLKSLSEDSLKGIQKIYGKGLALSPMTVSDDRENNKLIVTESYRVPTQKRPGKKTLKVYSHVIRSYLESGINPERSTPYALYYPALVKERIHIENPFAEWSDDSYQEVYDHESLHFAHSMNKREHSMDLYFEIEHRKDHVPASAIEDYCKITDEIEENLIYFITVSQEKTGAN